jgi:hypothetical protein
MQRPSPPPKPFPIKKEGFYTLLTLRADEVIE